MAMKKQPTPHEGAGHSGQHDGHGEPGRHTKHYDGGEKPTSTPVAGHTTGGGVKFGMADHHFTSGEGTPHKFAPMGGSADSFCHSSKSGQLRVSGKAGAHQIGKR